MEDSLFYQIQAAADGGTVCIGADKHGWLFVFLIRTPDHFSAAVTADDQSC